MPTDLVLLAADKDIEYGMRGLLNRPLALGIRPIEHTIYVHPQHDPGCVNRSHDFLQPLSTDYRHALVVFDHQGCGLEHRTPAEIEAVVHDRLGATGWQDRAKAIVIAPELEAWVFSVSPHVQECIGWRQPVQLRDWLRDHNFWHDTPKPPDPKAALEAALRQTRRPRSSAIYECLARLVSLNGCQDQQFQNLREVLRGWFPPA